MNLTIIVFLLFTFCICNIQCQQDLKLECETLTQSSYEIVDDNKICEIRNFTRNRNENVNIRIDAYENPVSITKIKFSESTLHYVPSEIFEKLPELKSFDATGTVISEITSGTFKAASNLINLYLANNELTKIGDSAFVGAKMLKWLNLGNNKLEELSESSFKGLNELELITLSGNKLKEIPINLFKDNQNLEYVHLDNNLLEHIGPEIFNDLKYLLLMSLIGNKLFRSPNIFSELSLYNISMNTDLILSDNNLTEILINGTRFVQCEDNHISTVHMVNSSFLEILFLARNNISDISNITKASGLVTLDLSDNKIGQLNVSTFDNLKRLRRLFLSNIGLLHIPFGMFSKQTELVELDLSFNALTSLNLDVFVPYMVKLREFYVEGNNLTEIQGTHSFATAFPSLDMLGISLNRFNCSYLVTILVSPYLDPSVTLRIMSDYISEGSSHVRGISCTSNIARSIREVTSELQQSLKANEEKLAVHLLPMKVVLWLLISVIVVIGIIQYIRYRRESYICGRRNNIVYNSEAPINTVNHVGQ